MNSLTYSISHQCRKSTITMRFRSSQTHQTAQSEQFSTTFCMPFAWRKWFVVRLWCFDLFILRQLFRIWLVSEQFRNFGIFCRICGRVFVGVLCDVSSVLQCMAGKLCTWLNLWAERFFEECFMCFTRYGLS